MVFFFEGVLYCYVFGFVVCDDDVVSFGVVVLEVSDMYVEFVWWIVFE